jgi:hypothetical protein
MHEKSVQTMMNQVPVIVHNALLGVGGVMNVAPLQLKGPSLLQPALMLTKGHPKPQGSGTSTCGESIGMRKPTLLHECGYQNPEKASSLSPHHSAGESQPSAMDVDDIARSPDDSAAGWVLCLHIAVVDFSTRSFSIVAFPSISSTGIRDKILTKLPIDVIVLDDFPLILY